MAAMVVAAVLSLGLCASLLAAWGKKEKVKRPHVPASTLPVLYNLLDLSANTERFHDWLSEMSEGYDHEPWMFSIPGRFPNIIASSPEIFEDVVKTQEAVFQRGPAGHRLAKDLFGNGLVYSEGDPWYYHHKTSVHLFSVKIMRKVMEETVREKLGIFLDVLATYAARGKPVGIRKEMHHFTMDVACKVGFGVELDSLKNSPSNRGKEHEFLEAFNKVSTTFAERIQSPLWVWQLKKFFNVGSERVLMANIKKLHDFLGAVILKSMRTKSELAAKGQRIATKDLVSLYMDAQAKMDVQMEDDEATIMRDMVVTWVFSAQGSTAHTLGWFVVNMNRHPEVLRKIRDEMHEKHPELLTGEQQVPTEAQLRDLVYLEAAMRENLRLFPSTGFIVREAMQDTTLCDGTFVKEGEAVMLSSYCNTRNKAAWGQDAEKFKPERYLDPATGKLRAFSPFQDSVFGSGKHMCIGKKFSIMEVTMTIATVFSKFDLKTVEDPWKITYEFSLSIPVKGPIDVEIIPLAGARPASRVEMSCAN